MVVIEQLSQRLGQSHLRHLRRAVAHLTFVADGTGEGDEVR